LIQSANNGPRKARGLGYQDNPRQERRIHALVTGAASVLLAASLCGAASADSVRAKSDHFLIHKRDLGALAPQLVQVILRVNGDLSGEQEAQLKALGGRNLKPLPLVNSVAMVMPTKNLSKVTDLPFVLHLSEDVLLRKHDDFITNASGAASPDIPSRSVP